MNRRPAYVLLACGSRRGLSVARFESVGETSWALESAVEYDAEDAQANATIGQIEGDFQLAARYAGCPRCAANSYVKCFECGRLSCWQAGSLSTCGWCGRVAPVSGTIDSLGRVD